MDHALRTISYIADIGDLLVIMARRRPAPTDDVQVSRQKGSFGKVPVHLNYLVISGDWNNAENDLPCV